MLYPIAIIIFSTICFVGILTFWIWVPLCMVITYIFNILIFQFEISQYPSGCLIKSVPLIGLFLKILKHLFKVIGPILFLLVISPLATILYFIWLILQRLLRTISDTILIWIMSCCARTPSRDTSMAKKISGPGMSRNYFFSIA
jgi:hypothetical protein